MNYKRMKDLIQFHFGTDKEFAKCIGVSLNTAQRYRARPKNITARSLFKMRASGIDVNDVLDIVGEGNEQ
jgi:hypothetical protein